MADEVANVALTKVVPTETTLKPYYDDFDEAKNFQRILFKPGYAVQARELTQMQTILQNQIERFGSHVFQNGSIVHGGQLSYSAMPYINLQSQYNSTDIVANSFIAKTINDASGNNTFEAVVVTAQEKQGNTNPVLMVAYRSGEEFNAGQIVKVKNEDVFGQLTLEAQTGFGSIATINDGIFFFNGYFIKKPKETIILDPFSKYPNVKIGLQFTQGIVNENSDTSLLDPAQEASNYQAPGADRLQIELQFTTRPLDSEDEESFIELMRIENGIKTKQTQYPIYSVLGETFARRTYDESGHYTVRPFRGRIADHPTDDTKLKLYLSSGKAYVKGYELETISEISIDIDRARDSQALNNIDVLANYGNDTIIKDLVGIVNTGDMPLVDLHCVPHADIDASGLAAYNQTKIGTARIRSLEYYSATDATDSTTYTYDTSLFDLNFINILANVISFTANTVSVTSANLTSANGAYAGGSLRFTSGNANGSSYIVTGYDGVTSTFTLNRDITASISASDDVSIDSSFSIVESLSSDTAYTTNADNDMVANIDNANRNPSGYTYLFDQKLNSLVFKVPYKFIKPGSISDQQYTYAKVFNGVFAGSPATISIAVNPSREAFNGVSGSGTSAGTLDNFIVVRVDSGAVVTLDSVSVDATTGVATLTKSGLTAAVIVIAKINLNSGPNVNAKIKALNVANTTLFNVSSLPATGTFTSTELGSTIDVYLDDGQAVITDPSGITGAKQYLHVSDVRRITKVLDAEGCTLTPGADLTGCKDVTRSFSFNNGQKESHYDYAWLELKPREKAIKGPLVVCFDWYDHLAGEGDDRGYFSVDSYPDVITTAGYGDIPQFVDTNGITYDLRDCIDFRPRRKNCEALTNGYTIQGNRIPNQATNFGCDLAYFLARADLLVVSKDASPPFILQQGTSGLSPVFPKSVEGSMPIYKINYNPYTVTKDDVILTYIENKRYTMRDIGLLEQRISNLEYYTSLSLLEKTATDMIIKDPNGLDRTKNGILVDNFYTHGIGDVWSPDYWISMDKVYGAAAPPINSALTKFFNAENVDTKTGKKMTTLDFTEVPAIIQPFATKAITIQPYQVAKYIGVMVMDPPADFWTDQQKAPDLIVNVNGENDNIIMGNATGAAPNQENNRCIRGKQQLMKYINSKGYTTFNSTKPDVVSALKAFGQTLTVSDRMSLANLVNTAICTNHEVGVWSSGRGNILSSWFGKTTR